MSERRMNSYCSLVRSCDGRSRRLRGKAYLPHIRAYLANRSKEQETGHPLFMAESGLPREVMEVLHYPLQYVLQPGIRRLRVDQLDIVGDVVNG